MNERDMKRRKSMVKKIYKFENCYLYQQKSIFHLGDLNLRTPKLLLKLECSSNYLIYMLNLKHTKKKNYFGAAWVTTVFSCC